MKHRQTDSDDAIDRVLAGLREVEPAQGMQQRVLRAATERQAERHKSAVQLVFANRYSWMTLAGSVALIGVAAFWTIARSHRTPQVAAHSPSHSSPANASVIETRLSPAPIARPQPAFELRRRSTDQQAAPAEPATDDEALAVTEMNAPSLPAPPMPLTDQERLLVQILHKGDPIELAMLDSGLRNSQETGDNADFDRFFKQPPKVVEIKLPPNNKASTGDKQ